MALRDTSPLHIKDLMHRDHRIPLVRRVIRVRPNRDLTAKAIRVVHSRTMVLRDTNPPRIRAPTHKGRNTDQHLKVIRAVHSRTMVNRDTSQHHTKDPTLRDHNTDLLPKVIREPHSRDLDSLAIREHPRKNWRLQIPEHFQENQEQTVSITSIRARHHSRRCLAETGIRKNRGNHEEMADCRLGRVCPAGHSTG